MPTETKPAPTVSEWVRSTADLADSNLRALHSGMQGLLHCARLVERGQHAEARDLLDTSLATIGKVGDSLARFRDTATKVAAALEKSEASAASTPAARIPQATRLHIEDIAKRVNAACVREVGRHGKHASENRLQFNAWAKKYIGPGGKLRDYIRRSAASVLSEDGAARAANDFGEWSLQQFIAAADPLEALAHWQGSGAEYAEAAIYNALFAEQCRENEERQLAAACA